MELRLGLLCATDRINMPVNLNLLPQDLQIDKNTVGFLKTIKALNVILMASFIFFCLGVGGFLIYNKIALTNAQTNVEQLTSQVKALEKSEQQLILLKDRLGKIASVKLVPNASKNITGINSLLANTTNALNLSEANISSSKTNLDLDIYSNEDLSTFLQNVKNSNIFKSVNLTSFSYNLNGYSLNMDVDSSSALK